MRKTLFSKDFTLVVGQIILLLGNATIRFALPLHLLNITGSAALYGTVTACAFLPAILLSLVGGIVGDRINKRNIMVILDFFTAAVILAAGGLLGGTGAGVFARRLVIHKSGRLLIACAACVFPISGALLLFSGVVSLVIALGARNVFRGLSAS